MTGALKSDLEVRFYPFSPHCNILRCSDSLHKSTAPVMPFYFSGYGIDSSEKNKCEKTTGMFHEGFDVNGFHRFPSNPVMPF
jgi:hypothetical protein